MIDEALFTLTDADEGRHLAGPEEFWGSPGTSTGPRLTARTAATCGWGCTPIWARLGGGSRSSAATDRWSSPWSTSCRARGCPALDQSVDGTAYAISWPEPYRRFRVTSRATGVVLPDPAQAFHGLDGGRVPVQLDLTWESRADVFPYAMATRYEISSWVTGTVVIGDETIGVDCAGQRDHSWVCATGGCSVELDFRVLRRRLLCARGALDHPRLELFATGYTVAPDGTLTEATRVDNEVEVDAEKLPTAAHQRIGAVEFTTVPVGHAPILLVAPDGRETRFARAMCRYTTTDGRIGTGWTEYNWPP